MNDLLNLIEKLEQKVAYKPRLTREHKMHGQPGIKKKQYYRGHKSQIKRRMKQYRRRVKNFLRMRSERAHYRRVG